MDEIDVENLGIGAEVNNFFIKLAGIKSLDDDIDNFLEPITDNDLNPVEYQNLTTAQQDTKKQQIAQHILLHRQLQPKDKKTVSAERLFKLQSINDDKLKAICDELTNALEDFVKQLPNGTENRYLKVLKERLPNKFKTKDNNALMAYCRELKQRLAELGKIKDLSERAKKLHEILQIYLIPYTNSNDIEQKHYAGYSERIKLMALLEGKFPVHDQADNDQVRQYLYIGNDKKERQYIINISDPFTNNPNGSNAFNSILKYYVTNHIFPVTFSLHVQATHGCRNAIVHLDKDGRIYISLKQKPLESVNSNDEQNLEKDNKELLTQIYSNVQATYTDIIDGYKRLNSKYSNQLYQSYANINPANAVENENGPIDIIDLPSLSAKRHLNSIMENAIDSTHMIHKTILEANIQYYTDIKNIEKSKQEQLEVLKQRITKKTQEYQKLKSEFGEEAYTEEERVEMAKLVAEEKKIKESTKTLKEQALQKYNEAIAKYTRQQHTYKDLTSNIVQLNQDSHKSNAEFDRQCFNNLLQAEGCNLQMPEIKTPTPNRKKDDNSPHSTHDHTPSPTADYSALSASSCHIPLNEFKIKYDNVENDYRLQAQSTYRAFKSPKSKEPDFNLRHTPTSGPTKYNLKSNDDSDSHSDLNSNKKNPLKSPTVKHLSSATSNSYTSRSTIHTTSNNNTPKSIYFDSSSENSDNINVTHQDNNDLINNGNKRSFRTKYSFRNNSNKEGHTRSS